MFESSKNDLARKVLFGERVKTILFLSMINEFPISFLIVKETQKIDQSKIKRGVVKIVSPGSGSEWERCFSGSFILDTDDDDWIDIKDVQSISLDETKDPRELLKHEMSLNRVQHFWQVYTGTTGRRKTTLRFDDATDSKYYKLLSYIKEKNSYNQSHRWKWQTAPVLCAQKSNSSITRYVTKQSSSGMLWALSQVFYELFNDDSHDMVYDLVGE